MLLVIKMYISRIVFLCYLKQFNSYNTVNIIEKNNTFKI